MKDENPLLKALRKKLRDVEKRIEKLTDDGRTKQEEKDLAILRRQKKHLLGLIDVEERQIPLFTEGIA